MTFRPRLSWVVSSFVPLIAASCATTTPAVDPEQSIGQAQQELVTNCTYLDPSIYTPLPVPVDFDKEGLIHDLSVVEDPCRTTWTPTTPCTTGTVGAWTFQTLMTNMAGTTPVQQFVAEWLDTFETPQTVNTFPVPPRANFRAAVLDRWLVASGCPAGAALVGPKACPLDLRIAPFRLLAIVNRLDLEGFTYGNNSPGEGRFVFGWLSLPAVTKPPPKKGVPHPGVIDPISGQLLGSPLAATVIFEYRLPPTQDFCKWGNMWHTLSSLPFGSTYNNVLQKITDSFDSPGVDPAMPNNGVSIGQVRTNDIDLGGNKWVLRQYELQDVGRGFNGFALANGTTAQTPDDSMNNHPDLNTWVIANEPDIINTAHSVPVADPLSGTPFLGGESSETFFVWEDSITAPFGPLSTSGRFHFGLSACNDCHTAATGTGFTHVSPRPLGVPALLSPFMAISTAPSTGSPTLPAFTHVVTDPFTFVSPPPPPPLQEFNEPWRRVCELNRILRCESKPFTFSNGGVH